MSKLIILCVFRSFSCTNVVLIYHISVFFFKSRSLNSGLNFYWKNALLLAFDHPSMGRNYVKNIFFLALIQSSGIILNIEDNKYIVSNIYTMKFKTFLQTISVAISYFTQIFNLIPKQLLW